MWTCALYSMPSLVTQFVHLHFQLQAGGWRKPLTMGNQTSETHDQFRQQPGISTPKEFVPNPQGFLLSNHHTDGPAKVWTVMYDLKEFLMKPSVEYLWQLKLDQVSPYGTYSNCAVSRKVLYPSDVTNVCDALCLCCTTGSVLYCTCVAASTANHHQY